MDDELREKLKIATSQACDAFMRRMGEKYPWLHPDYDPRSLFWRARADRAWKRWRRERTPASRAQRARLSRTY